MEFVFRTPGQIISGIGSSHSQEHLSSLSIVSPTLIISDPILDELGYLDRIIAALKAIGMESHIFLEVPPEPDFQAVEAVLEYANRKSIQSVIGIGGGSPMDVAKIAALLISTPQPLNQTYGVGNCLGQRLPLVLIPTTAGTGSEVTHVAVVTDDKGEKSPIVDAKLIADAVIIDPKLTEKLPPKITATTGIDAMVHAIESYTSGVRKNIISDHLAKQALKFLTENIVTAYHQGDDLEARGNMQMGSMLAGLAFANATVGAVHALSYPLGTNFHIPHGESNALVMMPVLKFNAEEAFQMYAELSMHLFPNVHLSDPHMSCEYLLGQFENILTEVKMKSNLSTYGVTKSDIDSLVTGTLKQDRLLSYNYRKMEAKDIRDCFLKII